MAEKEYSVLTRLPHPERIMLDMLTDDDGQSLTGEMMMLTRNEFKRRKMTLPDPLPEPRERKPRKGKQ